MVRMILDEAGRRRVKKRKRECEAGGEGYLEVLERLTVN
jgi:hypothetical protein